MIVLASATCLTGCWSPGDRHAGYYAGKRVITALEGFHDDHGQYPERLDELVPRYLHGRRDLLWKGRVQPLNAPGHDQTAEEQPLEYSREGDAYTLSFSYASFGMNILTYDSRTRKWHQSGYY
jgi:hypothetical protein